MLGKLIPEHPLQEAEHPGLLLKSGVLRLLSTSPIALSGIMLPNSSELPNKPKEPPGGRYYHPHCISQDIKSAVLDRKLADFLQPTAQSACCLVKLPFPVAGWFSVLSIAEFSSAGFSTEGNSHDSLQRAIGSCRSQMLSLGNSFAAENSCFLVSGPLTVCLWPVGQHCLQTVV